MSIRKANLGGALWRRITVNPKFLLLLEGGFAFEEKRLHLQGFCRLQRPLATYLTDFAWQRSRVRVSSGPLLEPSLYRKNRIVPKCLAYRTSPSKILNHRCINSNLDATEYFPRCLESHAFTQDHSEAGDLVKRRVCVWEGTSSSRLRALSAYAFLFLIIRMVCGSVK